MRVAPRLATWPISMSSKRAGIGSPSVARVGRIAASPQGESGAQSSDARSSASSSSSGPAYRFSLLGRMCARGPLPPMPRLRFPVPLRLLLAALFIMGVGLTAHAQQIPLGGDHVKATLAPQTDGAAPGSTLYVAVVQQIEKGWHTYWKNPGDAGEPTKIIWTLPAGWRAGDLVGPARRGLRVGPLMNYGFEGEAVLPVPIEVPASAKVGDVAHVAAKVQMLVCAEVCVPQDASLSLDVPIVAGAAPPNPLWGPKIAAALAAAPKEVGLAATFQLANGAVKLAVAGPPLAGRSGAGAYFFPDAPGVTDPAKAPGIPPGPQGLTFPAPAGDLVRQGQAPTAISGVVTPADGAAFQVSARPGPPPPGASGLGAPVEAP